VDTGILQGVCLLGYCKVCTYWDTAMCVHIELRKCVKEEHKVDVLRFVSHHQRCKEEENISWNSL
jgi:hypothetical protein